MDSAIDDIELTQGQMSLRTKMWIKIGTLSIDSATEWAFKQNQNKGEEGGPWKKCK